MSRGSDGRCGTLSDTSRRRSGYWDEYGSEENRRENEVKEWLEETGKQHERERERTTVVR